MDLERWALLAFTDEERDQVTKVRSTYMDLLEGTRRFFDLVEKRQLKKAMALMEDDLEKIRITKFEGVTEEAVLSDQTYRSSVNTHIQTIRQSAEIMLTIATFACISLILQVLGYLTSDIFAPIKELNLAMKAIKQHNYKYRLSEARKDELGDVNRTFNESERGRRKKNTHERACAFKEYCGVSWGDMCMQSEPEKGTYVTIALPTMGVMGKV